MFQRQQPGGLAYTLSVAALEYRPNDFPGRIWYSL
jgi:TATA-box binding protein (TBP) (component of TFIID and TFIIIB)